MTPIRIGTRGSALALAQAGLVAEAVAAIGLEHEIVIVETAGDRRAPDTAWGEGAFVAAIEQALLEGRADVAVHSAKDVPTDEDRRLRICAYLPRQDARDALVVAARTGAAADGNAGGRTLDELRAGSVIGTDSPRRTGFLLARRPDISVRPLHGNVDTRLRRLDEAEVDALVLAAAGLVRLGRADRIDELLPVDVLPPAPGQGAIAVQVRADDGDLIARLAPIDDRATRLSVEAERAFLRAAGGGCRAPIGALAELRGKRVRLLGGFASIDGSTALVDAVEGPLEAAPRLAQELAARLASRRAMQPGRRRVLITRPRAQSGGLAARLAEQGLAPVLVAALEIELQSAGSDLDAALARLAEYQWAIVTSANGARAAAAAAARTGANLAAVRWAAVGRVSAHELRVAGVRDVWQPAASSGTAVGEQLPFTRGERVLLMRGSLADDVLPGLLARRGAHVEQVIAYTTREAPPESRALLEDALAGGPVAAVLLASPSAVRGLMALAGNDLHAAVVGMPAIAIGPTTAAAAREAGLNLVGEAATQEDAALAQLTAQLLRDRTLGVPT